MKIIKYTAISSLLLTVAGLGFIYSGIYPVGADTPHFQATTWALTTLRESSISRSSEGIVVPDLGSPELLLAGGSDYNEMCTGCHLQPGVTESDMATGLYPSPPNLSGTADAHGHSHSQAGNKNPEAQAKRLFWIIKHGIKASGMPAWGPTHDDERIWAMVAFLQRLPELTPQQYQILTARKGDDSSSHH